MAYCDKCGSDFKYYQVKRSIDRYWGEGCYEWLRGAFCEYCATELLELRDEDGDLVEPKDIRYN